MGCADRSAFDLTQHSKATGIKLIAEKSLPEPKTVTITEVISNKASIGKVFKKDAKAITTALSSLSLSEMEDVKNHLEQKGYLIFHLFFTCCVTSSLTECDFNLQFVRFKN
mgnify:CR=1 FL=1